MSPRNACDNFLFAISNFSKFNPAQIVASKIY